MLVRGTIRSIASGYRSGSCEHILQGSRAGVARSEGWSVHELRAAGAGQGDREHHRGVDQAGEDLALHNDLRPPAGGIDVPIADRCHRDDAEFKRLKLVDAPGRHRARYGSSSSEAKRVKPRRDHSFVRSPELLPTMKLPKMNAGAEQRAIKPEGRSMSATHVVVEGTLKPDGSLELDSKPNLPPGRVQLIVQPLPELPKDDPFWQMMQRIWADRKAAD